MAEGDELVAIQWLREILRFPTSFRIACASVGHSCADAGFLGVVSGLVIGQSCAFRLHVEIMEALCTFAEDTLRSVWLVDDEIATSPAVIGDSKIASSLQPVTGCWQYPVRRTKPVRSRAALPSFCFMDIAKVGGIAEDIAGGSVIQQEMSGWGSLGNLAADRRVWTDVCSTVPGGVVTVTMQKANSLYRASLPCCCCPCTFRVGSVGIEVVPTTVVTVASTIGQPGDILRWISRLPRHSEPAPPHAICIVAFHHRRGCCRGPVV